MTQKKLTGALLGLSMSVTSLMATTTTATAEPFIGEVRLFGETFCPRGWADANGALLPIAQYTALFSILGTMFGGDGRTTMGLPNLNGRIPQSPGAGPGLSDVRVGAAGGAPTRVLTEAQMPSHSHTVNATNAQGNKLGPGGDILADPNTGNPNTEVQIYRDGASTTPNRVMDPGMIEPAGSNQPINVQTPALVMRWCVALEGLFPSRS